MREGRPVVWVYVLLIIACLSAVYVQSIINERDYYHSIATEQQRIITQQNATLVKMQLLFELMTGKKWEADIDNPINSPETKSRNPYVQPI